MNIQKLIEKLDKDVNRDCINKAIISSEHQIAIITELKFYNGVSGLTLSISCETILNRVVTTNNRFKFLNPRLMIEWEYPNLEMEEYNTILCYFNRGLDNLNYIKLRKEIESTINN